MEVFENKKLVKLDPPGDYDLQYIYLYFKKISSSLFPQNHINLSVSMYTFTK